jgi:hypothetical protein
MSLQVTTVLDVHDQPPLTLRDESSGPLHLLVKRDLQHIPMGLAMHHPDAVGLKVKLKGAYCTREPFEDRHAVLCIHFEPFTCGSVRVVSKPEASDHTHGMS